MTKSLHKRTAVASMFQNGISQNNKCAKRDVFAEKVAYFDTAQLTIQLVFKHHKQN